MTWHSFGLKKVTWLLSLGRRTLAVPILAVPTLTVQTLAVQPLPVPSLAVQPLTVPTLSDPASFEI